MSKKGDRLRDKAEELRTNADDIRVEECHRISLELAELAEELADQWDATIAMYIGNQVPAKIISHCEHCGTCSGGAASAANRIGAGD